MGSSCTLPTPVLQQSHLPGVLIPFTGETKIKLLDVFITIPLSFPLSFIPLSIPLSFNLSYLFILYLGELLYFLFFK